MIVFKASSSNTSYLVLFKHLSYHGGTTLCNLAQRVVTVPKHYNQSLKWSGCLLKQQYLVTDWTIYTETYDFIMFEEDFGFKHFPYKEANKNIKLITSVRHPMPLLAKVCNSVPQVRTRFESNMELCGFLPNREHRRCRSANISHQITDFLPRAQTNLKLFNIILVLEYYVDTAKILCTLLQWPSCDLSKHTIAYNQHRQKFHHRKTQGAIKHAQFLWQQKNCSSSFLDFDTAFSMHQPSILFYNFALSLARKQQEQAGIFASIPPES